MLIAAERQNLPINDMQTRMYVVHTSILRYLSMHANLLPNVIFGYVRMPSPTLPFFG